MRNGFFKFGFGSVLRKNTGSVQFRFGFEKRRFGLLCRSVVKYKKRVSCLSCVCILHFGRRFSNPRFPDYLLSDSVHNMKNV